MAGLRYGGTVRTLVHRVKFHERRDAIDLLAPPLVDAIHARREFDRVECVVPIPLHPWRRFRRGFDQAEILARVVARELDLPLVTGAIRRHRLNAPQSLATSDEKQRNVERAFKVGRSRSKIEGRTILLIDDVLTTGSTANAAATALLQGGARRVLLGVAAT